MDLRSLPDVDVLIVRDHTKEATYTIIVVIPGLPPITRYDVPLLAIVETMNLMRAEVMQ